MKIHNSEIFKITIYDFNPSYLEKPLQTSYTSPSGAKVLVLQKRNLKFENLIRKKNRFKKDVALSILFLIHISLNALVSHLQVLRPEFPVRKSGTLSSFSKRIIIWAFIIGFRYFPCSEVFGHIVFRFSQKDSVYYHKVRHPGGNRTKKDHPRVKFYQKLTKPTGPQVPSSLVPKYPRKSLNLAEFWTMQNTLWSCS